MESREQSKISIVIPVYNSAKTIGDAVECVLQQSFKPLEIIIVDDGSIDDTPAILRDFGGKIVYLPKENGGPASARNMGVSFAHGEYIAFIDSDCLPDKNWLLNLTKGFISAQVGGVGGAVRSVGNNLTGEYVDVIRLLEPQENEYGEIPYLITANACFRRDSLIKAGLFDERFRKPGGEEAELCYRIRELGYKFAFTPHALVYHYHRQTPISLLKTLANYGEGAYLIGKLWPRKRIDKPLRLLLRRLVSLKFFVRQLLSYKNEHGVFKAIYFSALDYLRQPAFLCGYLRGQQREP